MDQQYFENGTKKKNYTSKITQVQKKKVSVGHDINVTVRPLRFVKRKGRGKIVLTAGAISLTGGRDGYKLSW